MLRRLTPIVSNATREAPGDGPPVFIVGPPRSGTTILYRTLLQHSAFTPEHLSLEETGIFIAAERAHDLSTHRDSLTKYLLHDDARYAAFVNATRRVAAYQRILGKSVPGYLRLCRRYPLVWALAGGPLVVQHYFEQAHRARGAARTVEKTPTHVKYLDRIFLTYRNARVLLTVRHPVDVYASYRKRLQKEREMGRGDQPWLNVDPAAFATKYRTSVEAGLSGLAQPDFSVHLIRYEDFVSQAEDAFRAICAFIEAPFEAGPVYGECEALKSWERNQWISGPIKAKPSRWHEYLTAEEAARIESNLHDLMDILTYAPYADTAPATSAA